MRSAWSDPLRTTTRAVLLIDGCEHIEALQPWLREQFLPTLPQAWLTVCAGRRPPEARWRHDAQWSDVVARARAVGPRRGRCARAARRARRGARPLGRCAARWCRGHPLALSLLADVLRQSRPAAAGRRAGRLGRAGAGRAPDAGRARCTSSRRTARGGLRARHQRSGAERGAGRRRRTAAVRLAALARLHAAGPARAGAARAGARRAGGRHDVARSGGAPTRLRAAACRHCYERIAASPRPRATAPPGRGAVRAATPAAQAEILRLVGARRAPGRAGAAADEAARGSRWSSATRARLRGGGWPIGGSASARAFSCSGTPPAGATGSC